MGELDRFKQNHGIIKTLHITACIQYRYTSVLGLLNCTSNPPPNNYLPPMGVKFSNGFQQNACPPFWRAKKSCPPKCFPPPWHAKISDILKVREKLIYIGMASVASLEFCILKHFHTLFLSDFMAKNKNWPIKMCAKKSLPPPFDVPKNPCSPFWSA